ncbi:N-acetyltransferase family protein [Halobacteriales archaeon Cl-PHB]
MAETEGSVRGYGIATVDGATGVVEALYRHPDAQGRGHGSRLFDALCAHLAERGADYLEGHVSTANDRAWPFAGPRSSKPRGPRRCP